MTLTEALFRFSTPHAGQIYLALTPELTDEVNSRSVTRCWTEGDAMPYSALKRRTFRHFRAALNMALRLVNVADEMQDITQASP